MSPPDAPPPRGGNRGGRRIIPHEETAAQDTRQCFECGAPGFRDLPGRTYCASHLADLYRRLSRETWDGQGIGLPEGHRPDHGPEFWNLRCVLCGAGWVGCRFDPCTWCLDRLELAREQARRELLPPPWLRSDAGTSRYDDLSEVDKAVWDRTRGQRRDTDSLAAWAVQLRRAVAEGTVTADEAEQAIRRTFTPERGRRAG
jgi:hypothetical protein